jgi:hypothetical protein
MTAHGETLSLASRVNYSKLVSIEHNCKVLLIGKIRENEFSLVSEAVDECWSGRHRGLLLDDATDRAESSRSRATVFPRANVENSEETGTAEEMIGKRRSYLETSSLPQSSTYTQYPNARTKNDLVQVDKVVEQIPSTDTVSQNPLVQNDPDTQ